MLNQFKTKQNWTRHNKNIELRHRKRHSAQSSAYYYLEAITQFWLSISHRKMKSNQSDPVNSLASVSGSLGAKCGSENHFQKSLKSKNQCLMLTTAHSASLHQYIYFVKRQREHKETLSVTCHCGERDREPLAERGRQISELEHSSIMSLAARRGHSVSKW